MPGGSLKDNRRKNRDAHKYINNYCRCKEENKSSIDHLIYMKGTGTSRRLIAHAGFVFLKNSTSFAYATCRF